MARRGSLLALGLVVTTLALASSAKASSSSSSAEVPIVRGARGQQLLDELAAAAGLTANWRRYFMACAAGETGGTFHSSARNTSASEAEAAAIGYERGVAQGWIDCPGIPSSAWTWGSGGWLGLLPSSGWRAWSGTNLFCRDPQKWIVHPVDNLVCGIGYAERITAWSDFKADPTYLRMRVGWSDPSSMANPDKLARVRETMGKRLVEIGESPSFMDQRVDALPDANGAPAAAMRAHLIASVRM